MIYRPSFIELFSVLYFRITNSLYRFFLRAHEGIDTEFFLDGGTKVDNLPLFGKINRVLAYLEGVLAIDFFRDMTIESFHEFYAFLHITIRLVALELGVILQMF